MPRARFASRSQALDSRRPDVDVALVTFRDLPDLDPDDRPLLEALEDERLSFEPVAWDDPRFDWSRAGLALLRSTWDYHLRLPEFLAWSERAASRTRLWNPLPTIRWNCRKTYLRELEASGIPVVETVWLSPGNPVDLAALMEERGWFEAIVKPVVSGGAYRTMHVRRENLDGAREHIDAILASGEAMAQPYLSSVEDYGERSVVWIDGAVTHCVRKRPILKRSGADWLEADPAAFDVEEAALAERAIAASRAEALYARVDLVRDPEGVSRVLELEMIEPTLFFTAFAGAAPRLARALARLRG